MRTNLDHKTAADYANYADLIRVICVICGLILLLPQTISAHDIPADITIQAFLKPEPQNLRLLLRVPMKAMVDVEFPKRGPGYIDLARSDPFLRDAANLWISRSIDLYENDVRLPIGNLAAAKSPYLTINLSARTKRP